MEAHARYRGGEVLRWCCLGEYGIGYTVKPYTLFPYSIHNKVGDSNDTVI